jgi:predicted acylesterase/phospholipase RssA
MANDTTGAKSTPTEIKYLAFQGGGGKGVTYVGAVRALQLLINGRAAKDLPIVTPWTKNNQIQGVSGASAGAITALFVCMGYSADMLSDLLSNQIDFSSFFDGPTLGSRCYVTTSGGKTAFKATDDGKTSTQVVKALGKALDPFAGTPLSTTDITNNFYKLIFPNMPSLALLKKTLSTGETGDWLGSFLLDFGLCPGLTAVNFFSDRIQDFIKKIGTYQGPNDGKTLTFKEFVKLTNGVRLVLSGTNISQNKTFYFSDIHTPDFPVAPACLISMCLPCVFKPVWVDATVDSGNSGKSAAYKGLWVDGGVLNNFPVHAFDHTPAQSSSDPNLFVLEPGMLGFQLVPGFDPNTNNGQPASTPAKPADLSIIDYFGLLVNTLLYPSGDGQIRSPREAEQTIKLYTGNLSTLDFNPQPQDAQQAQDNAYNTVINFYP